MLLDIKNLDITLRGNHLDSIRRPDSPSKIAKFGPISAGTKSSAEFDRLSGELNLRIP